MENCMHILTRHRIQSTFAVSGLPLCLSFQRNGTTSVNISKWLQFKWEKSIIENPQSVKKSIKKHCQFDFLRETSIGNERCFLKAPTTSPSKTKAKNQITVSVYTRMSITFKRRFKAIFHEESGHYSSLRIRTVTKLMSNLSTNEVGERSYSEHLGKSHN